MFIGRPLKFLKKPFDLHSPQGLWSSGGSFPKGVQHEIVRSRRRFVSCPLFNCPRSDLPRVRDREQFPQPLREPLSDQSGRLCSGPLSDEPEPDGPGQLRHSGELQPLYRADGYSLATIQVRATETTTQAPRIDDHGPGREGMGSLGGSRHAREIVFPCMC
jgi:hypothetical protein